MPQKSAATNGTGISRFGCFFPTAQSATRIHTHIIHLEPFPHTHTYMTRVSGLKTQQKPISVPTWSVSRRERKMWEPIRRCADTRQNIYFSHPLQPWEACTCAAWQHSILFYTHAQSFSPSHQAAARAALAAVYLSDLLLERSSDLFIGLNQANAAPLFPKLFFNSHSFSPLGYFSFSRRARRRSVCECVR
jgi:hypothetical protein